MSKRKRRQSAGGKRKRSTKKKKETQEKASGTVNKESAACGQQAELRCEDDRAAPSSAEERGVAGSRSESEGGDGAHKLSPGVKDCFLPLAQNILPGRSSTAGTSCDDDDEDDDDDVAQPSAPEHTTSDQHRGAGEGPAQGDATLHSYGGAHGPNHKASTSGEQRQEADPERQQPTVTEQGGADEGGQEHLPHSAVYVNPCVLEERDWESRFAVLEMEDSSDAGAGQRKAKGVVRSRRCKPATSAAAAAAAGKREVTTALVCAETACPDLTHTEAEGSLQGAAGAGGQTDPASAAQDREEGGPHPCTPAAARGSPESQREDAGGTQSCEDHSEWDSEFLLDCSTQRFPDFCSLPAPLPILGTELGGSALELPLSIGSISDSQLHEITLWEAMSEPRSQSLQDYEDASELVCGLIEELSQIKQETSSHCKVDCPSSSNAEEALTQDLLEIIESSGIQTLEDLVGKLEFENELNRVCNNPSQPQGGSLSQMLEDNVVNLTPRTSEDNNMIEAVLDMEQEYDLSMYYSNLFS